MLPMIFRGVLADMKIRCQRLSRSPKFTLVLHRISSPEASKAVYKLGCDEIHPATHPAWDRKVSVLQHKTHAVR